MGLQKYWRDSSGNVFWVNASGQTASMPGDWRKIGSTEYGHSAIIDTVWQTNFEEQFTIDSKVHDIVKKLESMRPQETLSHTSVGLAAHFQDGHQNIPDTCYYHHIKEPLRRELLLLICSLLIRSPANRFAYENAPLIAGLPPNQDVGKINMRAIYKSAKKICRLGKASNQYFVLLHSPEKRFVFGDGALDWLTESVMTNRLHGQALIALTPSICIYVTTPLAMGSSINCASLIATSFMVDQVNEIIQIYSKERLFYCGPPPRLSENFLANQFLAHRVKHDPFLASLDKIAGLA
jgi:hypothetical protein